MDALSAFQDKLHRQYERHQSLSGSCLLGMIEIGSYARGEEVPYSDHDLRLIIDCQDPLWVLNEVTWTEKPEGNLNPIALEQLNQFDGMSVGLKNLAYIQKSLLAGRYPLVDHI